MRPGCKKDFKMKARDGSNNKETIKGNNKSLKSIKKYKHKTIEIPIGTY